MTTRGVRSATGSRLSRSRSPSCWLCPARFLLVGEGLGALLAVVGGDEGDALTGVGPVAELQLGGVAAGQGDGSMTEDLHALLSLPGHLQVHTGGAGGAGVADDQVASLGRDVEVEGAARRAGHP